MRLAKHDLQQLRQAIEAYRVDFNDVPETLPVLAKPFRGSNGGSSSYQWISELPIDPWGNGYRYRRDAVSRSVAHLSSVGPDGQAGSVDDVFPDP